MYRLKTTDSELKHRNGRAVTVLRTITEPDETHDEESLPMHAVRFRDGFETELWPDELIEWTANGPVYRDTL
jgi:hypothetical protein